MIMHRSLLTGIALMLIIVSLCTAGCIQSTTSRPPSTIPTTPTGVTVEPTVVTPGIPVSPTTSRVPPSGTSANTTINGTPVPPDLTSQALTSNSTPPSATEIRTAGVPAMSVETSVSPGTTQKATVQPTFRVNGTLATIPAMEDIISILSGDQRFSTLVTAIRASDMAGTLNGPGPFTVFAPTNDAFTSLPPGSADAFLGDPGGELTEILLYHIVPGRLTIRDLSGVKSLTTLQGEKLKVEFVNGTILIDEIEVIIPDINASNGEIQGIRGLLIPSTL
jgi:uncharacterized surface protein with fasciclin (FAS1) repeats